MPKEMPLKHGKEEPLRVVLRDVLAVDAHERLRRAFEAILRAAARAEEEGANASGQEEHRP